MEILLLFLFLIRRLHSTLFCSISWIILFTCTVEVETQLRH